MLPAIRNPEQTGELAAAGGRVLELANEIYPNSGNPEYLDRGSTMLTTTLSQAEWVGDPVPISPGFPIEAVGMTDSKIIDKINRLTRSLSSKFLSQGLN
jgi:hypothetical protein